MQFLQFELCDFTTGAAIPFGKCTVYLTGTATLAALFDSGGSSISNPAIAASNAVVGFAAADGTYDFQFANADGSLNGPKIVKQRMFDFGDETIYLAAHGIVADGVTINSAAAIEALITASTNGCVIHEPFGPWKVDRPIKPSKTVAVVGYGGAKGQAGGTGRSQAIAPAGYPAWIFLPAAVQSSVANTKISQTSLLSTVGTASYAGGTATTITGNTLLDIQNDMVIWLEGAGGSLVIPGRTFAVASGSNSVTATSSGSYGNFWGYVGQMVSIAGAGVAAAALVGYIGTITTGGSFTLVNAAGAALNASTTVTTAAVTAFAPLQTRVISGGGTATLTIDAYPYASLAVTGAKIRHAAPAIYSTTQIHLRNVEIGGDCQGGLTLAGITAGGNVADNCTAYDCMFAADLFGVSFQGNDAQVNAFYGCDFAGPRIAVLDNSFLGNYFYGCHWAFNCGLQSFNTFVQIIGGYFEGNTGWAAAGGIFFATTSLVNGAGLHGFQLNGGQVIAPYMVFTQTVSGVNAFDATGPVTFSGTGMVTIANNGNAFGGSGSATNSLRFFLSGGAQAYVNSLTDDLWLSCSTAGKAVQVRPDGDTLAATFNGSGLAMASGKSITAAAAITTTAGGIGYATGAGGTVTQTTGKSTGVTLNKLSGQITMNSASLAASTSVKFVLTNSMIAATDVLDVNIASGAADPATYGVFVCAVGSGSCTIVVRNNSTGALGEALVLNFSVGKAVAA